MSFSAYAKASSWTDVYKKAYETEKIKVNELLEKSLKVVDHLEPDDTTSSVYTGAVSELTSRVYKPDCKFGWLLSTYDADVNSTILYLRVALLGVSSYREVNSNSKLILKLSDGEIITLQTKHGTHYSYSESHELGYLKSLNMYYRNTYTLFPVSGEQLKKIVDKGIIKVRMQEVDNVYDGDICSKKVLDGKRTLNEDSDYLDWNTIFLKLLRTTTEKQIVKNKKINSLDDF